MGAICFRLYRCLYATGQSNSIRFDAVVDVMQAGRPAIAAGCLWHNVCAKLVPERVHAGSKYIVVNTCGEYIGMIAPARTTVSRPNGAFRVRTWYIERGERAWLP